MINENICDEYDHKWAEALLLVARSGCASISMLQRRLNINYNRADRIIKCLENEGIIGVSDGTSRPRDIFIQLVDPTEIESSEMSAQARPTCDVDEKLLKKALKNKYDVKSAYIQYLQIKMGVSQKDAKGITEKMVRDGILKVK